MIEESQNEVSYGDFDSEVVPQLLLLAKLVFLQEPRELFRILDLVDQGKIVAAVCCLKAIRNSVEIFRFPPILIRAVDLVVYGAMCPHIEVPSVK